MLREVCSLDGGTGCHHGTGSSYHVGGLQSCSRRPLQDEGGGEYRTFCVQLLGAHVHVSNTLAQCLPGLQWYWRKAVLQAAL